MAVDARSPHLPLADPEQVRQGEHGSAGTDVPAPEPRLQQAQAQGREEQAQRQPVPGMDRRHLVPAAKPAQLQRGYQEIRGASHDRDRRHEARDQHPAQRGDQRAQQQIVLDVHPPAGARNPQPRQPPADQPVEQVDQRAQGTEVAAEAARDQQADQQDGPGCSQRPDPGPRGDGGRQTDQRIDGQEALGRQELFARQVLGVVRRPLAGRSLVQRPRADADRQRVEHFRGQFRGRFDGPLPLADLQQAKRHGGLPVRRGDAFIHGVQRVADGRRCGRRLVDRQFRPARRRVELDGKPAPPDAAGPGVVGPADVAEQDQKQQQAGGLDRPPQRRRQPCRSEGPQESADPAGPAAGPVREQAPRQQPPGGACCQSRGPRRGVRFFPAQESEKVVQSHG